MHHTRDLIVNFVEASAATELAQALYKYQTCRSKIEKQAFLLCSLMGLCRAEVKMSTKY